jgi:AraC-like DNA-binding protein
MSTAVKNESLLRLLWANGTDSKPQNALPKAFSALCRVEEVPLLRIPWDTAQPQWDALCFDFDDPSPQSLTLVARAHDRWADVPIVMFTKRCSCALALWCLRRGLLDLLTKPLAADDITMSVRRIRQTVSERGHQPPRNTGCTPHESLGHSRADRTRSPVERLNYAKEYIDLHYNRPLPQTEVALVSEMSTSWFSREFKSRFGSNFLEYLTDHRVLHAQRLLSETSQPVAAIATSVGFADPAYFSRVFHKLVGISPSQYRARPHSLIPRPTACAR